MDIMIGLFVLISLTTTFATTPALILTEYIKNNKLEEARRLSVVNPSLFLNVTSHSGFLTVDEKYNSNTFFWYFPIPNKPVNETPWIVWLQGGPGASSIAGLFDEIGPFEYNNGLKLRQWSWTTHYSVLFIDNPIGAGFSYTDHDEGFVRDMETCSSHLYSAIRQFLTVFPELLKAPLYLAGESYAGRYLPALGMKILQQDRNIGPLDVNLQGIMMGNPVMNRDSIADYSAIYFQWGLIDSQGRLAIKKIQDAYSKALKEKNAESAVILREELLDKLDDMSMQQTFNFLSDDISVKLQSFIDFIEAPETKEALHVGNIGFTFSNNTVHKKLIGDFMSEVTAKVEMLLDHYRILIYCGQLDLTAPCVPSAQARRKYWQWGQRDVFLSAARTPWWYNNSVAGFVKSGGNFTEALVRGAGHLVPLDKPAQALHLVSHFIRGIDLPLPPNYHVLSQDTPEYRAEDDIDTEIPKTELCPLKDRSYSNFKTTMIISILLNVILVMGIIGGVVYALRWKRRTEAYMYNTVDENCIVTSTMF